MSITSETFDRNRGTVYRVALAQTDFFVECFPYHSCLAQRPQWLYPPGAWVRGQRSRTTQRNHPYLLPARRELPAERNGPLFAQSQLCQHRYLRKTTGAAMAEHGRGSGSLLARRVEVGVLFE